MLKRNVAFLFLFLSISLLQAQYLTSNVQFTDVNGKQYDLYQLLESGKHVYIQTAYDG